MSTEPAQVIETGESADSSARVVYMRPAQGNELRDVWFGDEVPESEQFRRYFGSAVTPAVIEQCILRAVQCGHMRDLTDLAYETLNFDTHLASVVGKRVRAVASVTPQIVPASGYGIDEKKAQLFADIVREQWDWLPRRRQSLVRLAWARYHGRALLEKVWVENGARSRVQWRVDSLNWIHPRRVTLGPDREFRVYDGVFTGGSFGANGFDIREVPTKFLASRAQLFDDYPEREGLALRSLYFAFFKRFGWRERLQLLEVYGKPYRWLETDPNATVSDPQLEAAKVTADRMGAWTTGVMPRGVKLMLGKLSEGAGQIHTDVTREANDELSKLVLGQTRTTDAKAGALGADGDRVAQDGETLVFQNDLNDIADDLTEQFAAHVILLNFGPSELAHAPRFELPFEQPPKRETQIANMKGAVSVGVPVKLDEVYESLGIEKPAPGDATVQLVAGVNALGVPTLQTQIFDPNAAAQTETPASSGETPPSAPTSGGTSGAPSGGGALEITPSDLASITTVNEGRASVGLGPLKRKDGTLDPDGELTISEFNAKRKASGEALGAAVGEAAGAEVAPSAATPDAAETAEPPEPAAEDADEEEDADAAAGSASGASGGEPVTSRLITSQGASSVILAAERLAQPSTVNGSPDVLVDSGVREAVRVTNAWAEALALAVDGLESPGEVFETLSRAGADLSLHAFARVAERRMMHALMLGALDANWEADHDRTIAPETFSQKRGRRIFAELIDPTGPLAAAENGFVAKPFSEALRIFRDREVLTKDRFEQLSAAAKRRSFTVARLARQELLAAAHGELARAMQDVGEGGPNLRDFKTFVKQRLESAGWTPANPSHVETIYRTNVMSGYSAGRVAQQTEPAVLALRPAWEWVSVRDTRSRDSHFKAHGTILPATHDFWKKAYPPAGFNCRCRVVSRSLQQLAGKSYTDAKPPAGLPDEGFDSSGTGSLLTADL